MLRKFVLPSRIASRYWRRMTRSKNLSLDESAQAVLRNVGNQSRYIQSIVLARDRVWRMALRDIIECGMRAADIIALCDAGSPNIHTVEDWTRPLRDTDTVPVVLERVRLAAIVSEWWCGNEKLRKELRELAADSQAA
jgi:hypothetical protein